MDFRRCMSEIAVIAMEREFSKDSRSLQSQIRPTPRGAQNNQGNLRRVKQLELKEKFRDLKALTLLNSHLLCSDSPAAILVTGR